MKKLNLVLRIFLALILLMPILGTLKVFPEPTAEMYNSAGWEYYSALAETGFVFPMVAIVFAVSVVLLFTGRQALAAILLAPITVNIMAFHWFLDAPLIKLSSASAYVFLALNCYLLWHNRKHYQSILTRQQQV